MALLMGHLIDGNRAMRLVFLFDLLKFLISQIDYSSSLREKLTNLLIILVYPTSGVILYNFPYIKYNSNNNNKPKPVQTIY